MTTAADAGSPGLRRLLPADSLLALGMLAASVLVDSGLMALGLNPLLPLAMIAPLAVRRARPVLSVVAVYLVGVLVLLAGVMSIGFYCLAVPVALFSVTAHGPRWASRTALGTGLLGCLLLAGRAAAESGGAQTFVVAFLLTAPLLFLAWGAGKLRNARLETAREREERLRRLAIERDQELRLAAQAERARIAREMHDIVAHSLSVMIAQADGGRYAAAADPSAATHALETIAETGRAALADMRRLLGVLRSDREEDSDAALAPQPAQGDLEGLVEQVRASGMRVSLVRMGTPRPLPPGVGLTAHRICQEALTNVMKHAGPDPTVTVLVQWGDTSLTLEISDDGRGASAEDDGAGHGLLGMRERATMLGGTLTAGPRPGGGFRVRAQIPLPPPGGSS